MLHGSRRVFFLFVAGALVCGAGAAGRAQDNSQHRGRKYKAPPDVSHIEVLVTRSANGKPVTNAAVIFRATKDGKDDGNLEVKTDPEGKAAIDVIQTGSNVLVQVFANGFATYADNFQVDGPSREIHVVLERPREQVSAYVDNTGKASTRKAGVQEPQAQKPGSGTPTLQPRPGTSSTPPQDAATPPASTAPNAAPPR